ncbi:Na+/H+ antiporter subunit G [bacterium]|nr:MAG: Na+/H+ antiporter subunit G [bacterium]
MPDLAINQIIGYVIICIGIIFDLFGVIGLVRLPDVYNRLQAATKCVTFGSAGILFGVFVYSGFNTMGFKAILCAIFILLTSPVSAHAVAKAAHKAGIKLTDKTVIDLYQEDKELQK